MKRKKSFHVLVVDDSVLCRRICEIALKRAGFVVTQACSVPEALIALRKKTPDALVCDLLLGTIGSGFDVITDVRSSGANVFCIAVTGLITPGIREQALGSGFDAFLQKPFFPSHLVELLSRKK